MTQQEPPRRSRGRPREFDKQRALNAALLLFWRQGYEGASIAQLTRAMKITAPSLYAAFGSKQQLYREALERYASTHGDPVARALAAPGPCREVIGHVLAAAARQFTQPRLPHGCLVANGALRCATENRAAAAATALLRRLGQDALRQRIEAAIAAGELPDDTDASTLAAFYAAAVQGMSVQAVDGATREQLLRLGEYAMAAWPAG